MIQHTKRQRLRELRFAKDADGHRRMEVDLEYRKQVQEAYRELYGDKPHQVTVHPPVRPSDE